MSNTLLTLLLTLTLIALLGFDLNMAHGHFRKFRKRDKISDPFGLWWLKKNPLKLLLAGGGYLVGLSLIYAPNFTLELPSFGGNSAGAGASGGVLPALLPVALLGLDLKLAHNHYRTFGKRDKISDPFLRWWLKTNRLKLTLAGCLLLLPAALFYLPELPLIKTIAAGPGTMGVLVLTLLLVALLGLDLKLTHGYFLENRLHDNISDPFRLWWLKRSPLKLVLVGGVYLFGLSMVLFPECTLDIPLLSLILNPRFLMYLFFSDTRILAGLILTVGMILYLVMDLFGTRAVFRDIWGSSRSFPAVARWWIGRNGAKLAIMGGVYLVGLLVAFIILPLGIYYFRSGPTRYLTNADNYFQAKKYQEAALELRNAIREEPGNAATHLALAQTLRQLNSLKEALEAAGTAAQLDPKLYQARLLQGTLALATGDNPLALFAAQAARRLQPEAPEPGALLARIYTAQKKFDQAALPLREQLRIHPEDQESRMLLIDNALTRRDFTEANREAEAGLKIKESASLQLLRSAALQGLGQSADAVTALNSAALLEPKSPLPYLSMAEFATRKGDHIAAMAAYEEALKRDPNNMVVVNNLACLLVDHDFDLSRAAALAGQFYQRAPQDPAAMDTLGWILSKQGKNNEALALLRRAATLAPTVGEVRYHLGAALVKGGYVEEGRTELTNFLKLGSNSADAAKARALLGKNRLKTEG